jgi:hypothetical protein
MSIHHFLTARQARCLELEGQNAELKGVVAEVTARMEKYRKAYKDIGEPASVLLLLLEVLYLSRRLRNVLLCRQSFAASTASCFFDLLV